MKKAEKIKQLKKQIKSLKKQNKEFFRKNIALQLKIDEFEENQALIDELNQKNRNLADQNISLIERLEERRETAHKYMMKFTDIKGQIEKIID